MYLGYWRLGSQPFDERIEPARFFAGQSHAAALHSFQDAMERASRLVLFTGESGSGKSMVLARLLADRESTWGAVTSLPIAAPRAADTLTQALCATTGEIGGDDGVIDEGSTPTELAVRLDAALRDRSRNGHSIVLIDRVQYMCDCELHALFDALSLPAGTDRSRVTAIVVGPASLTVRAERCRVLRERAVPLVRLRPLSATDTASYVSHLLRWSGATEAIFSSDALDTVHAIARGLPRRINRLCDLSLLVGFAEGRDRIDVAQVQTAESELHYVGRAHDAGVRDRVSSNDSHQHRPFTAQPVVKPSLHRCVTA